MLIKHSKSSAIIIILIGIVLLLLAFLLASIHLYREISVLPVPSNIVSFGGVLSPLIEATIRILYLGVIGWIASTITTKGITFLLRTILNNKNTLD